MSMWPLVVDWPLGGQVLLAAALGVLGLPVLALRVRDRRQRGRWPVTRRGEEGRDG